MEMLRKNPLPISILVALVIVGGGILALNKDRLRGGELALEGSPTAVTLASAPGNTSDESDTDKDGLPDWKEALYGSDLNNPDTDGDGTRDGDEVRTGRDPSRKGPGDDLNQFQDLRFATSNTDLLGLKREFFAKFLAERAAEIREVTLRDVIEKNLDASKFQPRFQVVDMKVSSDATQQALYAYGNEFGQIINKYRATRHRNETDILMDGIKTKSSTVLQELQYPATSYLNFSKDLQAMTVPMPVLKNHLLVVNGYDIMGRSLLAMQQLYTNPIEGAAGYEAYTKYRFDVTIGYAGIIAVLGDYKVTYTEKDPGYPFYWNTVRFPPQKTNSTTGESAKSGTIGATSTL